MSIHTLAGARVARVASAPGDVDKYWLATEAAPELATEPGIEGNHRASSIVLKAQRHAESRAEARTRRRNAQATGRDDADFGPTSFFFGCGGPVKGLFL